MPEQKILSLFAMNPEISFYGREIAEKPGLSLGSVHAALISLERSGFLIPRRIGKTKLFSLDTTHPAIPAFRVLDSILVLDPLPGSLKAISRRVILFGSYATGHFGPQSDLNILIVTNEKDSSRQAAHDSLTIAATFAAALPYAGTSPGGQEVRPCSGTP